jgi:hypothetical protein
MESRWWTFRSQQQNYGIPANQKGFAMVLREDGTEVRSEKTSKPALRICFKISLVFFDQ